MRKLSDKYILGDCMDYLPGYPDNHFQIAIIDPPYGIGDVRHTDSRKKHKKITWNNKIPTKEYFKQVQRVSKNQIIWGVNYYTEHIKDVGRVVHDRTGGGQKPQYNNLSDCDIASHSFGLNMKIFHYTWQGNVQGNGINWKNEGENARIHPTQKPIQLYKWLLKNYAKEGDLILDTHVGSGSSLIAFIEEGFDFIGFEIDEDHYKDSTKRVIEVTSQSNLLEFC